MCDIALQKYYIHIVDDIVPINGTSYCFEQIWMLIRI
jgi:hypothetical protein